MDFNKKLTQIKKNLLSKWWSKQPSQDVQQWLDDHDNSLSPWWGTGILDMNTINHGVPHPKNKTLKWFSQDTEQSFDSIQQTPKHWYFRKDNVNYTFNELGYRSHPFDTDTDFKIVVAGCSHTFGIGLDDSQTWPSRLESFMQDQYKGSKVFNLACPGGSNDWIARVIACSYDVIKPDLVIACWTYPQRREQIWDNGKLWQLNTQIPDTIPEEKSQMEELFRSWIFTNNDYTDYYNWMKNHWLVSKTCHNSMLIDTHWVRMNTIQNKIAEDLDGVDLARDLKHFGPNVHKQFAKEIYAKFCSIQKQKKNIK
jgi:hypothetical protein